MLDTFGYVSRGEADVSSPAIFAIDLPLTLMPGATHEELVRNLDGHVTAAAVLTARFEGHEVEELDVDDLDDVD